MKTRLVLSPSLRVADDQVSRCDAPSGAQSLQDKVLRLEKLISHAESLWNINSSGQNEYAAPTVLGLPSGQAVDAELNDFDAPEVLKVTNVERSGYDADLEEKTETDYEPRPEENVQTNSVLNPKVNAKEALQPIDLEMLKRTVSVIIREELRGTLGEKITSNIRKLVRGEIEVINNTSKKE